MFLNYSIQQLYYLNENSIIETNQPFNFKTLDLVQIHKFMLISFNPLRKCLVDYTRRFSGFFSLKKKPNKQIHYYKLGLKFMFSHLIVHVSYFYTIKSSKLKETKYLIKKIILNYYNFTLYYSQNKMSYGLNI